MKVIIFKIIFLLLLFEIVGVFMAKSQTQEMIQTGDRLRILLEQEQVDSLNLEILTQFGSLYGFMDIEKLFRSDIQYSTYSTQYEKGTGLGLTLCKEFIEKHQGEIWVSSELDKGSVFYLTLPFNSN